MLSALVVLAALVGSPAVAAPSLDPGYYKFAWQEYPDMNLHSAIRNSVQIYPDYDTNALLSSEYGEYETIHSKIGLVTCEGRRDGYLALIHYSTDGYSRLVLRDLPLPRRQSLTVSFVLPAEARDGLTRLLLWDREPDAGYLDLLARNPNWLEEKIPGLLTQQWFRRGSQKSYFPPWLDQFRPDFDRPGITAQIGWPRCRAVPTADDGAVTKDCSIRFDGRTEMGFDEYGAYGSWLLDWSSKLDVVFHLPAGIETDQADLVIYIERDPLLLLLSQSSFELTVNGWPLSEIDILQSDDEEVQPYAVRVSHYLVDGINTIEIKASPFAGVDILVHGIELWVY